MRPRLIIAAHGSSVDPASSSIVATLTARLQLHPRLATHFDRIEHRYLKQQPLLEDAPWDGPTVVVPFFMAHGYFVDTVLPRIIAGRATITPALGTADFAPIALDLMRTHAPADAHLLVVAHGTTRDPRSGETALALAERCRPHVHSVGCAFIDQPPLLADALRAIPAGPVVALPFFAIPGPHTVEEIPAIVAASGRDVTLLAPITLHRDTEHLLAELAAP